jgi:riboflavin synthase
MFTGIVEGKGRIAAIDWLDDAARMRIEAPGLMVDAESGASIAVNGICLTVVEFDGESFQCDVMAETLNRSSLSTCGIGDVVNLERAARVDSRLGGHIMQGHVDGIGTIRSIKPSENWVVIEVDVDAGLLRYIVEKGSIAVDGVSLTVAGVDDTGFWVSCIPTTLDVTTLGTMSIGDIVNIEVDIIGKYVEKFMMGYRA